jgi:hypothetical protein
MLFLEIFKCFLRRLHRLAAQRSRRRKGAAIGRKCESETAAHRANPSLRQTLPLQSETLQEIPIDAHLTPRRPIL